jgi:hypothetical protein
VCLDERELRQWFRSRHFAHYVTACFALTHFHPKFQQFKIFRYVMRLAAQKHRIYFVFVLNEYFGSYRIFPLRSPFYRQYWLKRLNFNLDRAFCAHKLRHPFFVSFVTIAHLMVSLNGVKRAVYESVTFSRQILQKLSLLERSFFQHYSFNQPVCYIFYTGTCWASRNCHYITNCVGDLEHDISSMWRILKCAKSVTAPKRIPFFM